MKSKTLTMVLVVSLAFNAASLVGYFLIRWRMQRAHSPEGRMELLATRLDLDEEQYKRFKQRREGMGDKGREFLAELIKDEPDQKLLEKFMLERLASRQEFMRDLRPEQRQKFVEQIISRRFSGGRSRSSPPAK